jgi:NAD(P)-dependent dehydrogenase (short-subunit alcohol dehydrogenase family)
MKPQSIEGKVALVTGANRGIGRALVDALLSRGAAKVYAAARDVETLRGIDDARVVALQLDVTDQDQVRVAASRASDIELLFSNAGVQLAVGIAADAVIDQARREMDVNYFGPLRMLQSIAPTLARNGGGAVIHVGSLAGLTAVPALPTYSASKAALHGLTQAARALLAVQGTSVFEVYPGPVDTDMTRGVTLPKASAHEVALAILDAVEAGCEDIFPDPFAAGFAQQFEASPKSSERQFAGITVEALFGAVA